MSSILLETLVRNDIDFANSTTALPSHDWDWYKVSVGAAVGVAVVPGISVGDAVGDAVSDTIDPDGPAPLVIVANKAHNIT